MPTENISRSVLASASHVPAEAEHEEIVRKYKQVRAAAARLAEKLLKALPKGALDETGERLGRVRGRAIFINCESDFAVLTDYCLHDVRSKGLNAIESYAKKSPPDANTDESRCLRAMQSAIYSVFVAESIVLGVGLYVRDLVSDTMYFVVDISLSKTAEVKDAFASRLWLFEEFAITSGAALPIGRLDDDMLPRFKKALEHDLRADARGYRDPAALIRSLLEANRSAHIRFEDPTGAVPAYRGSPAEARTSERGGRGGRNDPL